MGARPSAYKKGGGGFLNNVDGVITDYEFSDEVPSKDGRVPFKKGRDPKTGKEKFHSLYCYLTARADGADEDVSTALFAGGADDFNVSDDGHVIWDSQYETAEEAAAAEEADPSSVRQLGDGTGFSKLMRSLVESGFPESNLPEFGLDFSTIIGTRVRFVQRVDEESTKKLGKRKGQNGKEYNRTDLVVDQVYELPSDEAPAPAKGKGGKATTSKGAGKSKGEDLNALATTTLQGILASAPGNTINKKNLATKVIMALTKHPKREDVRGLITSDDFLGEENGWSYNAKTGAVTAVSDDDESDE